MKEGWQIKTISDLCDVIAGQSPEGRYYNSEKQGIPFYQGKKDFGEKYVEPPTCWTTQTTKVALEGDILMSVRAPVGPVNYATQEICIGRGLAAIRSRSVDRDFLFYQLLYLQPKIAGRDGAVFSSINKSEIESLTISVSPLPEQQRIVAILDAAFADLAQARANAEKNLANAKELFASELNAIFTRKGEGWVEKKLYEVAEYFGRGKSKHRPRNDPKLYDGQYPFIQTGDVRNSRHVITTYSQTYNDVGLAQSKLWPKWTVCITIAANIAETGVLDFDACFPDSIIGFIPHKDKSDSFFVGYLMDFFKLKVQEKSKGSAQQNINLATFENMRFPFPSLTEQKRIVARLDELSEYSQKLEAIYKRKLFLYDEMKQSLLHQAFSGEL